MDGNGRMKKAAVISIILSGIYLLGAAVITAAPGLIVSLFSGGYQFDIDKFTIPVNVYLNGIVLICNIAADILIIRNIGKYSPFVILISSFFLLNFTKKISSFFVELFISHTGGLDNLAAYNVLDSCAEMLYIVTFAGIAVTLPLTAAYIYQKNRSVNREYRSSGKYYAVGGIVLLSLYLIAVTGVILLQKELLIFSGTPEDILTSVSFFVPVRLAVLLILGVTGLVFCIRLLNERQVPVKAVFFIAALYQLFIRLIDVIAARISSVNVTAYQSAVNAYASWFEVLFAAGILLCTAAAAVKETDRIYQNDKNGGLL